MWGDHIYVNNQVVMLVMPSEMVGIWGIMCMYTAYKLVYMTIYVLEVKLV